MRVWGAIAVLGLLAACESTPMVTSAARAPRTISVANASVVIAAPKGYCIDTKATRDDVDGAIVVLGSCEAITGRGGADGGLLLAAVSQQGDGRVTGAAQSLAEYFTSIKGRAALSRNGRAASVTIHDTRIEKDTLFLRLTDTSVPVPGVSNTYWRAMFDVSGRIATVSVLGFDDTPLSSAEGLATAKDFAARIRGAN